MPVWMSLRRSIDGGIFNRFSTMPWPAARRRHWRHGPGRVLDRTCACGCIECCAIDGASIRYIGGGLLHELPFYKPESEFRYETQKAFFEMVRNSDAIIIASHCLSWWNVRRGQECAGHAGVFAIGWPALSRRARGELHRGVTCSAGGRRNACRDALHRARVAWMADAARHGRQHASAVLRFGGQLRRR